ncbi:hypothetical protein [Nocardia neocaledoniensis]|uniref:hypothetical protein n=1 Tax=Nocardia neocaledoniensis TaxID=236511 RepID=UPI002458527B|nr:hypothetical protein [Nocardia neocaledoniensis]
MASEQLQKKLILHREKEQLRQLIDNLHGIQVGGHRTRESIPSAARDAFREFNRSSYTPNLTISDSADKEQVTAWYRTLFNSARIGKHFWCSTTMENFPFIECSITGDEWLESLRTCFGDYLDLVAYDDSSVAATFEDEYRILGFYRILSPRPDI